MSKEDKVRVMARFRLLAEQERRQQSLLAPVYRAWELAFPLVGADDDDDAKAPGTERDDDGRRSVEDEMGMSMEEQRSVADDVSPAPSANTTQKGSSGTSPRKSRKGDVAGGGGESTKPQPQPQPQPLSATSQLSGLMLHGGGGSLAARRTSGALQRRRPPRKKPLAERLAGLVRMEGLYDEYLGGRLAAATPGLPLAACEDAGDVDDGFAKFCAEKRKKGSAGFATGATTAGCGNAATAKGAPAPGARPAVLRQTSQAVMNFNNRRGGADPHSSRSLRSIVDASVRADRAKMTLAKREAVLVRHRSFGELYDLWASHRMFEALPVGRSTRPRALSFPQGP